MTNIYHQKCLPAVAMVLWASGVQAQFLYPLPEVEDIVTLNEVDQTAYETADDQKFIYTDTDIDGNTNNHYLLWQIKKDITRSERVTNNHGVPITGNFIGLNLVNNGNSGAAVFINYDDSGNDISGNFIGNYVENSFAYGGAIGIAYNVGNVRGNFFNNHVLSTSNTAFGGVAQFIGVGNISGNFIGNYARSLNGSAYAGVFTYDEHMGYIPENQDITGNFIGNYTHGKTDAYAGVVMVHGDPYNNFHHRFVNVKFLHNYARADDLDGKAYGGAIVYNGFTSVIADGGISEFTGNYAQVGLQKNSNAIYGYGTLYLQTANEGRIIFNDGIEITDSWGSKNLIEISGDGSGIVALNNNVKTANVNISNTTLKFGRYISSTFDELSGRGNFTDAPNINLNNAVFDIANGYLETVKLKGYSATDSFLHIDVDPDNMAADELHIAGNVEGVTKMIVHASSNTDIRGKGGILFAQSENDTTGNAGSFVVSRVYKSPYLFDVKYDQIAENSNKWSLEMNGQDNPDTEKPEEPDVPTPPTPELPDIPSIKPQPLPGSDRPVAPEVIGAESLPAAALAQNTNMIYNIMQKVSSNRFYCPGCGFYDYYWNGEAFHNLWANAVYNTLRIKTPTDIDAEVWGIEAGGDLQHDLNNKLGLFLSYRKGNYDMNGDGKHHYSTIGSEIDIDSYLAGLYYRYDRNNWWGFATVYGGIQKADLKTKDGIKSDTDGVEFGGSIELGYDYAVNKTVYLTPSVGAFYTQVDYDDARDSAGKVAKYNTLRQLELEAGVKLTKAFVMDEGYANLYVKPSVVRTITDGDEVRITGLGKVNTVDDQTLGRIEVGGRYGFTEQLSAYGWANHTFGDDYKASTVGLGLSYSW